MLRKDDRRLCAKQCFYRQRCLSSSPESRLNKTSDEGEWSSFAKAMEDEIGVGLIKGTGFFGATGPTGLT